MTSDLTQRAIKLHTGLLAGADRSHAGDDSGGTGASECSARR